MADRLRVRDVPGRLNCFQTEDGYVLFDCAWRHARVAVMRPGGALPFAWLMSADEAAQAIEADRAARGVR